MHSFKPGDRNIQLTLAIFRLVTKTFTFAALNCRRPRWPVEVLPASQILPASLVTATCLRSTSRGRRASSASTSTSTSLLPGRSVRIVRGALGLQNRHRFEFLDTRHRAAHELIYPFLAAHEKDLQSLETSRHHLQHGGYHVQLSL
jgi:hypothetical protein